jgi:inner membrane protein
MLYGALAQTIPDFDFVAALWNDTASNLLAHRGFTHSLLFMFLVTVLLAFAAVYLQRRHSVRLSLWMLFFGLQLGSHLFVDLFNNYGVGLFEPFSHQRVSFNAMFVADPFFSVWPAMAFIALLLLKPWSPKRVFWWRFALAFCSVYLGYCSVNKWKIDADVRGVFVKQHIPHTDYLTTPTPLNNWLWFVVAKDTGGYYVGYRSVFDRERKVDFQYFPQNASLLTKLPSGEEIQHLLRFSQGFYTLEQWHDTLVFNDLRFGQIIGWHDPSERFVFHYFLRVPQEENRLVVQRGRFAKWNWATTQSLVRRIRGG